MSPHHGDACARAQPQQCLLKRLAPLQVARNYTAQTLMLVNASQATLTQYDVIAVSAMEGIGVAAAMQQQQQTSGRFPACAPLLVPALLCVCQSHAQGGRAWRLQPAQATAIAVSLLSNSGLVIWCLMHLWEQARTLLNVRAGTTGVPYVFVRANSDYTYGPVKRAADGKAWMPADIAVAANNTRGYKFAIATSSTAILTMLQHRCLASGPAAASGLCKFSPLEV